MHFLSFASAIAAIAISVVSAIPVHELKTRQVYSGDGTFYNVGLGACGVNNVDTDLVVAVSYLLYDSYPGATANPNLNPICGRSLIATYGGKSVQVTVVDRCTGCAGIYDLDFSPSAFTMLADESVGRLSDVTWNWV